MDFFLLLTIAIQAPHIISSDKVSLSTKSEAGLFYRIYIVKDKQLDDSRLKQLVQGANDLMSSTSNIHLQVTGIGVATQMPATAEQADETVKELESKGVDYDGLIFVGTTAVTFNRRNVSCSHSSIGSVNLVGNHSKKNFSEYEQLLVFTTTIYLTVRTKHPKRNPASEGPCACDEYSKGMHIYCLSDYLNVEYPNSRTACSCWNNHLNKLIQDDDPSNNWTPGCMTKKDSNYYNYSILGNGIQEEGEQCDCTANNATCKLHCFVETPTTTERITDGETTPAEGTIPTSLDPLCPSSDEDYDDEEVTTVKPQKVSKLLVFVIVTVLVILTGIAITFAVIIIKKSDTQKKTHSLQQK
jgi:hypothetical protein